MDVHDKQHRHEGIVLKTYFTQTIITPLHQSDKIVTSQGQWAVPIQCNRRRLAWSNTIHAGIGGCMLCREAFFIFFGTSRYSEGRSLECPPQDIILHSVYAEMDNKFPAVSRSRRVLVLQRVETLRSLRWPQSLAIY